MTERKYQTGQWVIYRKSKMSDSPGPRAHNVQPATKGDTYSYVVDKYWVISRVLDDGHLILRTRRGKEHRVSPDDHDLRPARWWERWFFQGRFVAVERAEQKQQPGGKSPEYSRAS